MKRFSVVATLVAVLFSVVTAVRARRDAEQARWKQDEAEARERDTANRHRRDFVLNTLPYLAALENDQSTWEVRNEGMMVELAFTNKGKGPALTKSASLRVGNKVFEGVFDNHTVVPDVWVTARFAGLDTSLISPGSEVVHECCYEDAFGGRSTLNTKLLLKDAERQPGKPARLEIIGNELTNETLEEISAELRLERQAHGYSGM